MSQIIGKSTVTQNQLLFGFRINMIGFLYRRDPDVVQSVLDCIYAVCTGDSKLPLIVSVPLQI